MSKNSVKTILITLYLSAVQDPEPLLFDDFLGHILAEKCQLAAAIDGGVPLNFDPEFQFWGTFPPKQGARKASHTIFRPTGCIALWVHSIKDF